MPKRGDNLATISSALALQDSMSKPMQAITKAMNSALTAIRSIKGAELGPEFAQAAADVRLATDEIDRMNQSLEDTGRIKGFESQEGQATAFNAALELTQKGLRIVKSAINEIGELTALVDMQRQAETSLAVVLANMGNTYEDYQNILEQASALSVRTTLDQSGLLAGMAEIATYVSDPAALEKIMPTFADFAIGMNAGDPQIAQAQAVQYATALGKALQGQYDGLTRKGFTVSEQQKEIIATGTEMEIVAVVADIIGESWDGMAESIAQTDLGKIVQMENQTNSLKAAIGEGLYPYLLEFKQFLSDVLNPALEFVAENLDVIVPIVTVLGAAIGALAVVVGIYTVAQWAMTAAALAWPGTWIIVGIVALVAAIAVVVNKLGGFEIAWIKATDGIYNAVSWLKENALLLLDGLVNGAIDKVNWLIDKLNMIPGVEISAVEKVTFGAEAAIAEQAKREARTTESAARIAEIMAERETKSQEEQTKRLFETGGYNPDDDPINNVISGSGSNASVRTSGEVKIDGEDIKMMLDVSTRGYQQTFQTLAPQVDLGGVVINENADVDYFVNTLVDRIEEASGSRLD